MLAFLGLGAAGSNVADEAVKAGFPGIAINYSQKDLDSLEYVEEKLKLVGSEGVGKDRREAIRLISKNWESALSFVKENFSSPAIEIIVVSFSTGGGSGSGMAPVLLDLLIEEMPEKTFMAAPILPDLSEVIVNQMNCLQSSEELSQLNICVLPIDNEQIRKKYAGVGKNRIYKEANQTFVKLLEEIVSFTERESKNGVMDKKDLLTIFKTRGIGTLSVVDITKIKDGRTNLTEQGIAKMMQDSWKESIFAPVQHHRIVRAGVIFDGQDALIELINFQRIFEQFESGMPVDLFEGYYHSESGKVYSILSGLAWYHDRLAKIEEIIKDKQKATEQLMNEAGTYESNVQEYTTTMRKKEKEPQKRKSVSDILSKYRR